MYKKMSHNFFLIVLSTWWFSLTVIVVVVVVVVVVGCSGLQTRGRRLKPNPMLRPWIRKRPYIVSEFLYAKIQNGH